MMSQVSAAFNRVVRLGVWPIIASGLLCGCSFIPKDGPTGAQFWAQAEAQIVDPSRLGYAVVQLTPLVLSEIGTDPEPPIRFSTRLTNMPAAIVRIGPSDTLSLTVFEAAVGGIFIPEQAGARPGNFVQIPSQEVSREGTISVPYAGGDIRVVGRTIQEVQHEIEERLRAKAIQPQVIITINERLSNVVNVLGEVAAPARIPVPSGGIRLLTALARAGGPRWPDYESIVRLQRRRRVEQALLATVVKDPLQNIQLMGDDVVYVAREPRIFMALGATPTPGAVGGQNNRRFPFEVENMTLAEAVAKAGGLDSSRADAKAVFLFRMVPCEALARMGVDISTYPQIVPTVFTVDLLGPDGFFIANNFYMAHKDMIFVSDSPSVDLVKFLNVLNTIGSTARTAIGVGIDAKTLNAIGQ
jgi:polysaccharide biosynthesis/export protein